jgi:hypothetical protein
MLRTTTTTSDRDDDATPPTRRRRPSLGTVLGGAALFVALGGTSYAAATLPAKSVGAPQLRTSAVTSTKIKANAVTSSKVRDGSLLVKDFKAGQLTGAGAGAPGPKGDTGAKGDAGAKGETGARGEKGDTGPAGPLLDALPSGRSTTGRWAVSGHKTAGGDYLSEGALSFPLPLAAAPVVEVITTTPTAGCPGTYAAPAAAPGTLCFYADFKTGGTGLTTDASKHGATYFVSGVATGANYEWTGSWAVTAP